MQQIKDSYLYILQKNLANDCFIKKRTFQSESKAGSKDNFAEQTNQHTHPPSKVKCEVAKIRAGRKWHAMETVMTNEQILAE